MNTRLRSVCASAVCIGIHFIAFFMTILLLPPAFYIRFVCRSSVIHCIHISGGERAIIKCGDKICSNTHIHSQFRAGGCIHESTKFDDGIPKFINGIFQFGTNKSVKPFLGVFSLIPMQLLNGMESHSGILLYLYILWLEASIYVFRSHQIQFNSIRSAFWIYANKKGRKCRARPQQCLTKDKSNPRPQIFLFFLLSQSNAFLVKLMRTQNPVGRHGFTAWMRIIVPTMATTNT